MNIFANKTLNRKSFPQGGKSMSGNVFEYVLEWFWSRSSVIPLVPPRDKLVWWNFHIHTIGRLIMQLPPPAWHAAPTHTAHESTINLHTGLWLGCIWTAGPPPILWHPTFQSLSGLSLLPWPQYQRYRNGPPRPTRSRETGLQSRPWKWAMRTDLPALAGLEYQSPRPQGENSTRRSVYNSRWSRDQLPCPT